MICLIETDYELPNAPVLAARITSCLADIHHMITSVLVILRPGSIPMSTQGKITEKLKKINSSFLGCPQRQRAAELLLQEKFSPILISYNS